MRASSVLAKSTARHGFDVEISGDRMAREVLEGLTADPKFLPSKYFYDARGSKLFEMICNLPEYYPTRTELSVLSTHAKDIVRGLGSSDLVELGSGANWKIRTLLDALEPSRRAHVRYVPVDVCSSALEESAAQLRTVYPEVRVNGVIADFTRDLHRVRSNRSKLVLFLGSTIGNLDEHEAVSFLCEVAGMLNPGDRFLLGLDMIKPVSILEAAYNDSQDVTSEFNKNILHVLNRELHANFAPEDFDHVAFFNHEEERVEMHLRARRDLRVEIKALHTSITLRKGETIRTEICRKFTRDRAAHMIRGAGMQVSRWYTDPQGWFSLLEAELV